MRLSYTESVLQTLSSSFWEIRQRQHLTLTKKRTHAPRKYAVSAPLGLLI